MSSEAVFSKDDFTRVLTLAKSDLKRAESEAARLCRLHPSQPALENLRGVILVQMNLLGDAVAAFSRALKLEPGFSDALSNLASALSALNRDEEAARVYERMLAANARDPDLFFNYGNTLRKLGRNPDAINAYKHALNLRPLFPAAYNNMGNALVALGESDQAQICYENVLEIEPNNDGATRHLAQVHAAGLRLQAAELLYRRLLERKPQDVDALLGLATCLVNAGNQQGAIDALQRVMAITPSAAAPRFLLDALCGNARHGAPPEYVRSLFDGYADRFEQEQTVGFGYRGPAELRELFGEVVPADRQYGSALDIGCGTGLAAAAFKSLAGRFTGVDLSAQMLAKARDSYLYDKLIIGEAVEVINASADDFDLVLCCDTLPYAGDLMPLFEAVATRTLTGGHFLCSTEQADSGSYQLQTSARFAHSPDYVIECASAAGFDLLAQKKIPLRKNADAWTSGGIYCFVRRA